MIFINLEACSSNWLERRSPKPHVAGSNPARPGFEIMFGKFGDFIRETKQELNKVTWPSRPELWQATVLVIFTTFVLALYIGLIDSVLSFIMRVVLR